ncbi:hypothetical protein K4749_17075 [Streptomyces sp. TRM72054]|uniref:hypothetical protein n=1 Tax=Streptomyces sp. TRM72054 TaxID=2870562 RepID=UPI001C8C446B|nr:hypothetical protein [Streptomyces sp. TRM72054]MBX9395262.1 hypothetical protein [Streptomyces sp. TRM72054]
MRWHSGGSAASSTPGAVRDHQHRSAAHLPSPWCGYRALDGDLLAHALKDPLGDSEFVSLGLYLRQLLGQPFFEHVQFHTAAATGLLLLWRGRHTSEWEVQSPKNGVGRSRVVNVGERPAKAPHSRRLVQIAHKLLCLEDRDLIRYREL